MHQKRGLDVLNLARQSVQPWCEEKIMRVQKIATSFINIGSKKHVFVSLGIDKHIQPLQNIQKVKTDFVASFKNFGTIFILLR